MKVCFFFLICASVVLFGCQNTSENTAVIDAVNPGEVFVGHGGLDKTIKLQNFTRRETNGLMEVQVDLKNTASSDVAVEYSFEWFDRDGFKIETPIQHWTPVTLNGKHVLVVSGISPKAGAQKFKIHVRYPHQVTK